MNSELKYAKFLSNINAIVTYVLKTLYNKLYELYDFIFISITKTILFIYFYFLCG